jgi:uncharacterized membrane protein
VTKLATILHVAAGTVASNFFIGTFTIHLVATAWMTVRRKQRSVGVPEKTALNSSVPLRAFRDSELSGGDRIEAFLFVPQLSSPGMLIFWIVRVRFTGWYKDLAPN